MANILTTHPLADEYSALHTSPEDEVLHQIHEQSLQHSHATMLSTEVQGQFLSFISQLAKPKYVLEIGTFTGYSALCMCKGLQASGELHTIELREADAKVSLENFQRAGKQDLIHLHRGNALEIIPTLDFKWDLVFIDADKTGYITYYEMVLERLSDEGMIIADNVLFHGQVLEDPISGKNAKAIDAFNKHVANDPRTQQVLLTIRDGLLLIKKKPQ